MTSKIDHLVYAVPELEEGIRQLEELLGLRAFPGGQHPGFGTHNAMIGLGKDCYLELIAPDPEQNVPSGSMWFGIDQLQGPKLISWAARVSSIEQQVANARTAGIGLGDVVEGGRNKPDGTRLRWKLSNPTVILYDGIFPFLIEWGQSNHPSQNLPHPCQLLRLEGFHPHAVGLLKKMDKLHLKIHVSQAPEAKLKALIQCPKGRVVLE